MAPRVAHNHQVQVRILSPLQETRDPPRADLLFVMAWMEEPVFVRKLVRKRRNEAKELFEAPGLSFLSPLL